jgi:hypothetical protein
MCGRRVPARSVFHELVTRCNPVQSGTVIDATSVMLPCDEVNWPVLQKVGNPSKIPPYSGGRVLEMSCQLLGGLIWLDSPEVSAVNRGCDRSSMQK